MKKNLNKTLLLNKSTIARLNNEELNDVKGKAITLITVEPPMCTIPCYPQDELRAAE